MDFLTYAMHRRLAGNVTPIAVIKADYDAIISDVESLKAAPVENTGSPEVALHNAVNAYLENLRVNDPELFETERRKRPAQIAAEQGL